MKANSIPTLTFLFLGLTTFISSQPINYEQGGLNWQDSCVFSKKQSPISLPDSRQTSWNYNLGYEINYKTIANGTLEYTLSQLLMNLDTTTIAGSMLFNDIDGNSKLFKLKNMSFHAPSEHTLNGKYYDAELQIVHQAYDSNEMAIISVLFDSQKDISSCLYEKLAVNTFNRINATNATKTSTNQNTTAQRKIVSSNPLKDYVERMGKSFYYYCSLSIPPCTDSAHWIVMSEVQYITDALNKLWRSNPTFANGRGNNRLVQELNDRPIYYRHVSLEEHFESLTNHFMLPEGALINGGSSQISQHTLNTSTSKALFSFSKAERRSMAIKTVTDVVGYDVPDFKSQRACSFGIGDRKIPRTSDSPPPTCYNLKSVFDNKKPDGKAFTFGLSKEHFQRVYLENHPARDRDIPGPGEYNPQEKIGEKSQKITISGRTNNPLLLTSQRFVPGPGTYEPRNSINKNGQYVLSNMKSTLTPSFSLPSLAGKLEPGRKMDQVELMKYVPGPGSYTPKLFLGDRTVSSNHQSASQKNMPGPGSYQTISEFNLYAPLTTTNKTFKTQRNSQFDQTIDLKNSSLYSNNPKISEVKKELPSQTQSFVQQVKQNSQASNTNHQKTLSVQVKQDSQPKEGYIAQLDNNSKLKNHTKSKIESSGKKSIVKVNDARLKKESKSLQDTLAQSKPLLLDKQKVTSQQKPFDQPQKGHIKTEQNVSVLKEETQSKIQTQVEQQQHQLKQIQAQQDIQSLPTWQRRKTEITAESQVFNPKPKQSPPLSDQSQIQSKQPSQNPSGLSQNQPPPVLSHNQSENQKPTDLHNNVGNGVVEVKENRRRQQEGVPSQLKQDL